MSRTHPRIRPLLRRFAYGSPDERVEALHRFLEVYREGAFKERARLERRGPRARDLPLARTPMVPIRVTRSKAPAFFPATRRDLRAVMERLPPGSTDGIDSVRLLISPRLDGAAAEEIAPGVLAQFLRGFYRPRSATIVIYAYFFTNELPRNPRVLRRLKIEMLQTLVHEIAHHVDCVHSSSRGHAHDSGVSRERFEARGRRLWARWCREIVKPYVAQLGSSDLVVEVPGRTARARSNRR